MLTDPSKGTIGIWFCKFRFLFVFASFFFSAQSTQNETAAKSDPVVVVLKGAYVYSNDAAFNAQISKSTTLHKYSEVIPSEDGKKIQIISKTAAAAKKKKRRAPVRKLKLVAPAAQNAKPETKPVKSSVFVTSQTGDEEIAAFSFSRGNCFLPATNDISSFTAIQFAFKNLKNLCIVFVKECDYFYKNDNLKSQIFLTAFSVRPPPFLV